jgi:hypothetical protein
MTHIKTFQFSVIMLICLAFSAQAKNIIAAGARNVKAYGAKGDGMTDDTQAFLDALNQGRDNQPNGYMLPVAVYVPPGIYLIKRTLILWKMTLLFGEWTNPPTLVLAPNSPDFQDPSNPNSFIVTAGGYKMPAYSTEWRVRTHPNNSANNTFYIFLEDLNIKIGRGNPGCDHAIFWACGQQTGIRNVSIDAGGASYAIEAGLDGGGGIWSGLTVNNGGTNGVKESYSEMMVRDCTFNVPVLLDSYYSCDWVFLNCTFNDPGSGVSLANNGFATILNSRFSDSTPLTIASWAQCHLENIQFASSAAAPKNLRTNLNATGFLPQWTSGEVIENGVAIAGSNSSLAGAIYQGTYKSGVSYPRPSAACVNIKNLGAKGDGVSDDTAVIQRTLQKYTEIFFPIGTYNVRGPLTINAGQKLFGQSVDSTIQLAADSVGFGAGASRPFVSVNGRGHQGVTIVGLCFYNGADGGVCCLWDADSSSIVMDCQWLNGSRNNTQTTWHIQNGGGYVENCWIPASGTGSCGMLINSSDPLWLYAVQPEHYAKTALRIEGASNVVGLNWQFETSPHYLSIKNSQDIYLNGVVAWNWNFDSEQLVEIQNSRVSLFGQEINRNSSGIVVDSTTSTPRQYGTSQMNGNFVNLGGFIKH